eukprot:m.8731 g.8731  ORF g.8731 m.8731 type:complete len:453 (-) comp5389_c0_seq1:1736-3094(-)
MEAKKAKRELHVPTLLAAKREGEELKSEDISEFISSMLRGEVSHEQIGAFLMAVYWRGMTDEETTALTRALIDSGDTLNWSHLPEGSTVVDKHSTGGVGDKISLVLAPALASCGCFVPMISGRGLGHTGGTLDKLDSIPGYSFEQPPTQLQATVAETGCAIVGQSETLVPGDRTLYRIRDVTSTVGCIPLIVASIMSKKIAERPSALLLDVKTGTAAFMDTMEKAVDLAEKMTAVGNRLGIKTIALVTEMSHPIGFMVGNALEVQESVECLQGKGPADLEDLVCLEGGHLLHTSGLAASADEGIAKIREVIKNGTALAKFSQMLQAQGVSKETADALTTNPTTVLPQAPQTLELKAAQSGFVEIIQAMPVAIVSGHLGAGRKKQDDVLDYSVGVQLKVARGAQITEGDTWAVIHFNKVAPTEADIASLQEALKIVPAKPEVPPRFKQLISKE